MVWYGMVYLRTFNKIIYNKFHKIITNKRLEKEGIRPYQHEYSKVKNTIKAEKA